MEKGESVKMELTREELQRKIEQITKEIHEVRKKGLRDEIARAVYKFSIAMLDEDLASKMEKKRDIEIEKKDLKKKLDMLRLRIQEREAREA